MFCQNCGNKVDDNASFCPVCGAPLKGNNQQCNNQGCYNDPYHSGNANFNNNQQNRPTNKPKETLNVFALLGFIVSCVSFFTSYYGIIGTVGGFVLSIIGYNQCKKDPTQTGNGFAVAGIIIGACSLGFSAISLLFFPSLFATILGLFGIAL